MTQYTPTENGVRNRYLWWSEANPARGRATSVADILGEFDRWLRSVKADAWKEGYRAGFHNLADIADHFSNGGSLEAIPGPYENPYEAKQ